MNRNPLSSNASRFAADSIPASATTTRSAAWCRRTSEQTSRCTDRPEEAAPRTQPYEKHPNHAAAQPSAPWGVRGARPPGSAHLDQVRSTRLNSQLRVYLRDSADLKFARQHLARPRDANAAIRIITCRSPRDANARTVESLHPQNAADSPIQDGGTVTVADPHIRENGHGGGAFPDARPRLTAS